MISSSTSSSGMSPASRPGMPPTRKVEVVMPQMGVSVADGTIVEWRKQVGDPVSADETVCEVTTDKIDVEIPAPADGVLTRILVPVGETVAVGTVIAELEGIGNDPEEASDEAGSRRIKEGRGDAAERAVRPALTQSPAPPSPSDSPSEIDRSSFISPIVRRIADEHGIDLDGVEGHGVGGRIRKADVLAAIEDGGPATPANGTGKLHSDSPYRPEENGTFGVPDALIGPSRREPLSPMRRAIAEHMLTSRRTSAHCTTIVEADFSAAAARRRELEGRSGRPTYLAFVARAVVAALGRHPILNASIDGNELVHHNDVNLGIAVALDDGLVVPVIRRAQLLSVEGLAEEIAAVASRARAGELQPDDTHGGTFTITNPGQFGALLATPIINQPQVAILDLEAVVRRPVAIGDGAGGEAVAIRSMGYLCMSWDHRALDGAAAARFLADVRAGIERGDR